MDSFVQETEVKLRFETFSFGGQRSPVSPTEDQPKRNSHHRRRSSVSTRRESADMMGVQELAAIQDNVHSGDKDSIRMRALWALEGKQEQPSATVHIPELTSTFDFPSKPSFPPGSGAFGMGKRDSFKMLASLHSSKDQLGTLLEEEEEEEEEVLPITKPTTPSRPRPATLTLRPLALASGGLPTPTLTPAAASRTGLKSLSLAPKNDTPTKFNRSPFSLPPTPRSEARPRSSISYRTSSSSSFSCGLPTPEMTPSSSERERRFSSSSSSDSDDLRAPTAGRPLSASEQHFLLTSHNSLVSRITDLERVLTSYSSRRTRSRTSSSGSSSSSHSRTSSRSSSSNDTSFDKSNSSSDEMLQLITDLKSERDELTRDATGWRQRVADLEAQLVLLSKRIDNERREAWVARSRIGIVETEKAAIETAFAHVEIQVRELRGEVERGVLVKEENVDLRRQLEEEREAKKLLVRQLETALMGPSKAPSFMFGGRNRGLFASVDSESSATDVEYEYESPSLSLKSVVEEAEITSDAEEEDNGLFGYEDEEDEDSAYGASSMGSEEDFNTAIRRTVTVPTPVTTLSSVATTPTPPPTKESPLPATNGLSKTWTFPTSSPSATAVSPPNVDRFFGCLEDEDDAEDERQYASLTMTYETNKKLFASGFNRSSEDSDEEEPSFFLPRNVGTLAGTESVHVPRSLDVVMEEDENEEEAEEQYDEGEENQPEEPVVAVNSAPSTSTSKTVQRKPVPVFCFSDEDEDYEEDNVTTTAFNFGRPAFAAAIPSPVQEVFADSPPNPVKGNASRGVMSTSFQFGGTPKAEATATFIRQPLRKPVPTQQNIVYSSPSPAAMPAQSTNTTNNNNKPQNTINTTIPFTRKTSSDAHVPSPIRTRSSSLMMSVDLSSASFKLPIATAPAPGPSSFSTMLTTSPLPSRLSFQAFTNFIPLPWSPRPDSSSSSSSFSFSRTPRSSVESERRSSSSEADGGSENAGMLKNQQKAFVSKERQLERLRVRMRQEQEGKSERAVDVCGPCKSDMVFL